MSKKGLLLCGSDGFRGIDSKRWPSIPVQISHCYHCDFGKNYPSMFELFMKTGFVFIIFKQSCLITHGALTKNIAGCKQRLMIEFETEKYVERSVKLKINELFCLKYLIFVPKFIQRFCMCFSTGKSLACDNFVGHRWYL